MKKNINIDSNKNVQNRADAERLSNRMITLTAVTILYAFLMLFLQKMSNSSETVLGALAFIQILFWGSIVGAMVCAALGAYKENKSLFTYCGIFVYIFWSMTVVQYCGTMGANKAYTLVYLSLLAVFVMTQVFYVLAGKGKMKNRKALTIFSVISVVMFLAFCAAAVALKTRFFGLI